MRHRELRKRVVAIMMQMRYMRGKALFRQRSFNERLIPKELGRNAEADAIISLIKQSLDK